MADVISTIEQDHRMVEQVFGKLQSGDGDRAELVGQLAVLLVPHTEAEEDVVYPAIEQAGVEAFTPDEAETEHAEAAQVLEELRANVGDDQAFQATLAELMEAVSHHVQEEEQEIFPEWRQKADPAELERLGQQFEQSKQRYMSAA